MNATDARLVIGPNASLSPRGALLFLGLTGAVLTVVSGLCAWHGFWPVIPFAGLELVALGAALWVTQRRNAYREVIDFDAERIVISFGMVGRGPSSRVELSRYWARVALEAGVRRNDPSRLRLGSSGHYVELGRCLSDDDRERLYRRIRQLLTLPRSANEPQPGNAPGHVTLGDDRC